MKVSRGTGAAVLGGLIIGCSLAAFGLSQVFGYNEGKGGPTLWIAIVGGCSLVGVALVIYGLWARRQDAQLYGDD